MQVATDLHTLLHNAGEPGPYVLAGHSAGGIYVLNFANAYPQDVAGVVLLDSMHPEQYDRMAVLARLLRDVPPGVGRDALALPPRSRPSSSTAPSTPICPNRSGSRSARSSRHRGTTAASATSST